MLNFARLRTESDYLKAKQYCENKQLEFPKNNAICFGAFDDSGNLVGFTSVVLNVQVEPLIAEQSLIAQILFEKALAYASSVTNQVELTVNGANDKVIDYAVRSGFVIKDENMTILRKEV